MATTEQFIQVLLFGLAIFQVISGVNLSSYLTSSPSQVDGILTACVGDQLSLTCSHDNAISAGTRWIISPPMNCSTVISHNPPITAPPCGPFVFQNITLAVLGVTQLNSTAVANINAMMNGSVVECRAGNLVASTSVANVSLCITDRLPAPDNLKCVEDSNGLSLSWDSVIDHNCGSFNVIYYDVTIVREGDGEILASLKNIEETQTEIPEPMLQSNQKYSISVSASIINRSCESEAANIVCYSNTSDSLSPTGSETHKRVPLATVVTVPVVLIIAIALIIVLVLTIFGCKYIKSRDKNFKQSQNSVSPSNQPQYLDPDTLTHTRAPDGALYTDIGKVGKINLLPMRQTNENVQQELPNETESSEEMCTIDGSKDEKVNSVEVTDNEDNKQISVKISKAQRNPMYEDI